MEFVRKRVFEELVQFYLVTLQYACSPYANVCIQAVQVCLHMQFHNLLMRKAQWLYVHWVVCRSVTLDLTADGHGPKSQTTNLFSSIYLLIYTKACLSHQHFIRYLHVCIVESHYSLLLFLNVFQTYFMIFICLDVNTFET